MFLGNIISYDSYDNYDYGFLFVDCYNIFIKLRMVFVIKEVYDFVIYLFLCMLL